MNGKNYSFLWNFTHFTYIKYIGKRKANVILVCNVIYVIQHVFCDGEPDRDAGDNDVKACCIASV